MQDFPTRLQRAFVELVTEYARAQGWKKSQFAQNVWPQAPAKAAAAKWSAMRGQAAHTGKPQGVLLSDAQQMLGDVEVEPTPICFGGAKHASPDYPFKQRP